jgi:hypothetical protein
MPFSYRVTPAPKAVGPAAALTPRTMTVGNQYRNVRTRSGTDKKVLARRNPCPPPDRPSFNRYYEKTSERGNKFAYCRRPRVNQELRRKSFKRGRGSLFKGPKSSIKRRATSSKRLFNRDDFWRANRSLGVQRKVSSSSFRSQKKRVRKHVKSQISHLRRRRLSAQRYRGRKAPVMLALFKARRGRDKFPRARGLGPTTGDGKTSRLIKRIPRGQHVYVYMEETPSGRVVFRKLKGTEGRKYTKLPGAASVGDFSNAIKKGQAPTAVRAAQALVRGRLRGVGSQFSSARSRSRSSSSSKSSSRNSSSRSGPSTRRARRKQRN